MIDTAEKIDQIGYVNPDCEHALISIFKPALATSGNGYVQVAITIDGAIKLYAELDAFLRSHHQDVVRH